MRDRNLPVVDAGGRKRGSGMAPRRRNLTPSQLARLWPLTPYRVCSGAADQHRIRYYVQWLPFRRGWRFLRTSQLGFGPLHRSFSFSTRIDTTRVPGGRTEAGGKSGGECAASGCHSAKALPLGDDPTQDRPPRRSLRLLRPRRLQQPVFTCKAGPQWYAEFVPGEP